jgi:hypothetical protein
MNTIICKIGEIKANDKGEVIVKFTSTTGEEFAGVMGLTTGLVAVNIEPITQHGELDLDDEVEAVSAPDAPAAPDTAPLALESGEIDDADYVDVETGVSTADAVPEPPAKF